MTIPKEVWLREIAELILDIQRAGVGASRLNAGIAVNAVNYSYSDSKNSFSWAF